MVHNDQIGNAKVSNVCEGGRHNEGSHGWVAP